MSRLPFGRTLAWTDDALQETDIDGLVGRHCNLHQKVAPTPEEYLSLSTLATEYIHYLADRPQTARETLSLILKSAPFEKHWQETCCFQSENLYTPAINSLLDKLDRKLREGDAIPIEYQNCRSSANSSGWSPTTVRQDRRCCSPRTGRATSISTGGKSRWCRPWTTPTG